MHLDQVTPGLTRRIVHFCLMRRPAERELSTVHWVSEKRQSSAKRPRSAKHSKVPAQPNKAHTKYCCMFRRKFDNQEMFLTNRAQHQSRWIV